MTIIFLPLHIMLSRVMGDILQTIIIGKNFAMLKNALDIFLTLSDIHKIVNYILVTLEKENKRRQQKKIN